MGEFFGGIRESAILYAKHLGWLSSIPEYPSKNRNQQQNTRSRYEINKGTAFAEVEPEEEIEGLVNDFLDCGIKENSGGFMSPLSWSEINGWAEMIGENSVWIKLTIRKMSEGFVTECNLGKDPTRLSPIHDDIDVGEKRASISRLLKQFVSSRE